MPSLWAIVGDWCMPWWKRTAIPESMSRPDARTEKVIDRLEVVAERMEAVAKVLADEMDVHDEEQHTLHRIIKEASRSGAEEDRSNDATSRGSNGGNGG